MNRFPVLLLLFLLILPLGIAAEEQFIDILQLSENCGCELRYDYWKGLYELRKGRSVVRFSEGCSWYIVNMNEIRMNLKTEKTEEGNFLIDSATAADVAAFFAADAAFSTSIKYIVLDPGHGGKDPGAIGYYTLDGEKKSLREKDVVLQTALETAKLLEARYPDKKIILTRSYDWYPELDERTEIANSVELADDESRIFISIHANASFKSTAKGFEVWCLPPEYRRDLINSDSLKNVDSDVLPILNTMLEEEFTVESVLLGEKLLVSLDEQVGNITDNRGLKEESWFVVRNARMPSVLIELGFVTNQEEAVLLSSTPYLKKLSKGIYNGIVDFINDYERTRGYSE